MQGSHVTDFSDIKAVLTMQHETSSINAKCIFFDAPPMDPIKQSDDTNSNIASNVKKSKTDSCFLTVLPKNSISALNISQKNFVSVLNELKPGLSYNILEQIGPAHSPTFKVAVEVNGQNYIGRGGSKKLAKCKAAEMALQSFIQLPNNNLNIQPPANVKNLDFTSDAVDPNVRIGTYNPRTNQHETSSNNKSAVMILNELYPKSLYECIENSNDLYSRYKVVVKVNGREFVGMGSRKKIAKHSAAASALSTLLDKNVAKDTLHTFPLYKKQDISISDQQFADHVERLILDKFNEVVKNHPYQFKRKVIAGIIMTYGPKLTDSEVIAVTTGTKCISGQYMSMEGTSLNDLHAEILSRRCLELYLYDQLELCLNQKESIFEMAAGNGFKIKSNLNFHLYINTAPCGDARIFTPHQESEDIDLHPQRNSRGLLRTKIESGEGSIPIKIDIQTWDGIVQGERLLTMACSDKIARWNVLGLQGALLSHFMEPIYLKTVVIGSLFKEMHLYRAICGRIENTLQGLPPPYLLNKPMMLTTTSLQSRHPCKAPTISINWVYGYTPIEVVNCTVGKPENGHSRLCKYNFLKRFSDICQRLDNSANIMEPPIYYNKIKISAKDYNIAKKQMVDAFSKGGCGSWLTKPLEQDDFMLKD
ncbi:hypothetical protein FQA39_LY13180 [Lamprigera yunnana]|nr:hypothetical protein FQA39_LY13180 [Lamprigera yunnana]